MMGPHGQVRCKHFLSNTPLSSIPSNPPPLAPKQLLFILFTTHTHTPSSASAPAAPLPSPGLPPLARGLFSLTPRRCQPPLVATSFYESRASGGSGARSSTRPGVGRPCVGLIIHCLPHPPEAACGGLHNSLLLHTQHTDSLFHCSGT